MTEGASRVRFRAEALAAHAGGRRHPATGGPLRVPRWPAIALTVLAVAVALAAATVRVPRHVNATVVAADARTIRCLVPASVPARRLLGRPARIVRGHHTTGKPTVTAAERVETAGALAERGIPPDTPTPVVVVVLDRGRPPATAADPGRSPVERVAIETSHPPLLTVLLSRGE
ncbi:hypothetical protein [Streptomyces sp. NPDC021096]|uniref:hypothetical protein n=1 Tax=Streptomyces sp. NPDC021096 TaxID=3154792 RepID=UPI0033E2716B